MTLKTENKNFKLIIESLDNDAFQDGNQGYEVARILRKFADQIEEYGVESVNGSPVRDINGNSVGVCLSDTTLEFDN